MYVVASLLNPAATRQVQEVWQQLELKCGLAGIKLTPLPHFSWQTAEEYNLARVEEVLQKVAERTGPFSVRTTGLGLFTGINPVLYAPIVKTKKLIEIQEAIWRETEPFSTGLNPHYETNRWIPHITLAYRDVTSENLSCAVQEMAFQPNGLEVVVDHLAMIYEVEGQIGIKFRYDFKGN